MRRFTRILVAIVAAAAVAVPVAAAESSDRVQIGGELVRPTQLSTWQSTASMTSEIHASSSGASSFRWSDAGAGAGIGAAAVAVLIGSTALVLRKRRLATA